MPRLLAAAAAAGLWAALLGPAAVADHDTIPIEPFRAYGKLDPNSVTVSGISSGGFFAHQFHVAHSGLVKGAGIVAGGPFACAETKSGVASPPFWPSAIISQRVVVALAVCTRFDQGYFGREGWRLPAAPEPAEAVEAARSAHAKGLIDDPAHLAHSKVWLFSGDDDRAVPAGTVEALRTFYRRMGVAEANLHLERGPDAEHGMPVKLLPRGRGAHCRPPDPSFLIQCDYGAAELLLRHLYPDSAAAPSAGSARGRLIGFDQTKFFDARDASASLNEVGYLYVPAGCDEGPASALRCRLHVAFHGCEQYVDKIHDRFLRDAGYNAWAEANHVIVLYPQATRWVRAWDVSDPAGFNANPKGCWDWWGYSGADGYYGRNGKQMRAVKAMIDHMLGR